MHTNEKRAVFYLSLVSSVRMLGLFMLLPVLPIYAPHFPNATPFLVAMALGIYAFPQAILQIPAGMLSDYFGRKSILITGMILFFIGTLVAALAHDIFWMIIGRFMQGTGAVASTISAFLADLTTERYRTRAMAFLGMSIGCSFCLAMVIGPLIASTFGIKMILWLTLIFCVFAIFLVVFALPRENRSQLAPSFQWSAMKKVLLHPQLLWINISVFFLHFTLMQFFMNFPILLSQNDFPLKYHGLLYLVVLISSFFIMLLFLLYSEKNKKFFSVFQGALVFLFCSLIMPLLIPKKLSFLIISSLIYFIAFNFLEASLPSLCSKVTPQNRKGMALGVYSSFQFLGTGLGSLFSGIILQSSNYKNTFILSCVIIAAWWILSFFMKNDLSEH